MCILHQWSSKGKMNKGTAIANTKHEFLLSSWREGVTGIPNREKGLVAVRFLVLQKKSGSERCPRGRFYPASMRTRTVSGRLSEANRSDRMGIRNPARAEPMKQQNADSVLSSILWLLLAVVIVMRAAARRLFVRFTGARKPRSGRKSRAQKSLPAAAAPEAAIWARSRSLATVMRSKKKHATKRASKSS